MKKQEISHALRFLPEHEVAAIKNACPMADSAVDRCLFIIASLALRFRW